MLTDCQTRDDWIYLPAATTPRVSLIHPCLRVLVDLHLQMEAHLVVHRAIARPARHVAIARYTLPIWMYVSITGVVIYVVLYGLPGRGP